MTQGEIAELLGMSQMHVSRLLRRSLGRLRQVAKARAASPGREASAVGA
jgi:DNA-directed RNA polymerase specialized sigma subunit